MRFTQPGHVGNLSKDGRDFVDLAVVVGVREDVAEALAVGAVSNLISGRTGVKVASKGGNTDLSCRCEEVVISVLICINKADGDPIGVLVKVFSAFT